MRVLLSGIRIRYKIIGIITLINLLTSTVASLYAYNQRKQADYRRADTVLRTSVRLIEKGVREELPEEPTSPTPNQDYKLRFSRLLSRVTNDIQTDFIHVMHMYTLVKDQDAILFTAVSDSPIPGFTPGAVYDNPPAELKLLFREPLPQPEFVSYTNEHGRWRGLFKPSKARNGIIYVIAADVLTKDIDRELNRQLLQDLFVAVVGFIVMTWGGVVMAQHLLCRPLMELSAKTQELVSSKFSLSEASQSSLKSMVKNNEEEVSVLAHSILTMHSALHDYIVELTTIAASRERFAGELEIAHNIQYGFLPNVFPPFPDRTELDLFAMIQPESEVGGDLYDFFWIDKYRLFFVIGDVSDKGIPAALFMAVIKTLLKTNMLHGVQLSDVLGKVNDELSESNSSLMFVTLFCGILDVRTGEVECCDGGHNAPYLLRNQTPVVALEKVTGIALGFWPRFKFESQKITLSPGEAIFLFTDGVTEAMNPAREQFTNARLQSTLERLKGNELRAMLEGVMSEVHQFAAEARQSDDIAMLVLRYLGRTAEPRTASAAVTERAPSAAGGDV